MVEGVDYTRVGNCILNSSIISRDEGEEVGHVEWPAALPY